MKAMFLRELLIFFFDSHEDLYHLWVRLDIHSGIERWNRARNGQGRKVLEPEKNERKQQIPRTPQSALEVLGNLDDTSSNR